MGNQLPPPQKGGIASPQFSAHVYYGHTAAWVKMPLGMEVGLGPSDFVLDGNPAPLYKKAASVPSQFSAHVYCGHGRASQLLLSSCFIVLRPKCYECRVVTGKLRAYR